MPIKQGGVMAVMALALQAMGLTAVASETELASSSKSSLMASPIGSGNTVAAPWRLALLPRQKPPATQFDVTTLDEQRVLRVLSNKSYGNIVHAVGQAGAQARRLQWRWRVDEAPGGDLRKREGDDAALKVCVFFDWPSERLSFGERARLEMAQTLSGQALPTATLCYVWSTGLPAQTWLPNAYTRRIRLLVAQGEDSPLKAWHAHVRDLHADFKQAFADEWREGDAVPAIQAVLIGGDTDNTGSKGLGYVSDIALRP